MSEQRDLSRRAFLRLAALAAAGSAAVACTAQAPVAGSGTASAAASPQPSATIPSAAAAGVTIAGAGSDVWGWRRQVRVSAPAHCSEAWLETGRRRVELSRDGELWTAELPLGEGPNEVVATCLLNAQQLRSEVSILTVPLKRRPTAEIRIRIEPDAIVFDGSGSRPDESSGAAIQTFAWSPRPGNRKPLELQGEPAEGGAALGERISARLPTDDGEYYVQLRVVDADGREDTAASYFVVENGKPRVPDFDREAPAWVDSAVVYGVVVRKFGDPGFPGIVQRLDYLRELGVDALWLSPINVSPGGDYGYAVVDYFKLNPDFGSEDDFRSLIGEAHARGIRVLMDFVPNHSSAEHPYYIDAVENGEASPYYSFYDRDETGAVTHYFDWEHLPNLNYNNPEVERWMLEAFSYWVREFDVDGFRVDVAWGVTERKPDFWPRWRRELKRIKPDLLLLAEASAREAYYFENGYDAAYDWTAQVGKWAWEIAWDSDTLLVYNLNGALTNNNAGFAPNARVFRFLNNNDTGTRFITEHGEELTRVATAMLLTVPGIPCVYTGDEIGAWFRPYYDELPLVWDENKYPGLLAYHKKLIALRKQRPELHAPGWEPLLAQANNPLYGYLRFVERGEVPGEQTSADRAALVLLNFGDQARDAELELPERWASSFARDGLWDALNDELVAVTTAGTTLTVPMPAWGARIMWPVETRGLSPGSEALKRRVG